MTVDERPRGRALLPWLAVAILWVLTIATVMATAKMGGMPNPVTIILSGLWTIVYIFRGRADAGQVNLPANKALKFCISWGMLLSVPLYLLGILVVDYYSGIGIPGVFGCLDAVVEWVTVPLLVIALAWVISQTPIVRSKAPDRNDGGSPPPT